MTTDTLPLVHDGDSYHLILTLHEHHVQLTDVIRFDDNRNTIGTSLLFRDLTPDAKRAVIAQINRRHQGRMVKV